MRKPIFFVLLPFIGCYFVWWALGPSVSTKLGIISFERAIQKLTRREKVHVKYFRRPETLHIDCGRVLRGDENYTNSISDQNRVSLIENPQLDMSCEAIKNRVSGNEHLLKPLKMSVAFARIVYQDYEFLEKQVQVSWHPHNAFCFVLDSKAEKTFKEKIRRLGECIFNVYVVGEELDIDSAGHNTNLAHYKCMQTLTKIPNWTYLTLLQNHDVISKSIYEISRILELLGGANDVQIVAEMGRVDKRHKWDLRTLKLFRNESQIPEDVLNRTVEISKGLIQSTISRAAVDWMVDTVDPTVYFSQWSGGGYGSDEQWMATFQSNEFLGMPGHFTGKCVTDDKTYRTDFISRWNQWHMGQGYNPTYDKTCGSKLLRHSLCLIGIEYFPIVAEKPNLSFNKMMPTFDYSIVECTAELLHNRTFMGQEDHPLDENYYLNMVNVLYHKHHMEPGYVLNCTRSYQSWSEGLIT